LERNGGVGVLAELPAAANIAEIPASVDQPTGQKFRPEMPFQSGF
jgi:hypothetical protein